MSRIAFVLLLAMGSTVSMAQSTIGLAGKMEKLPIEGIFKVTEADGSVKYLSENRRFVFVGTMYDLWQGEAMTAGVSVSQRVDWDRNGVSIDKIAFSTGNEYGDKTLFVAPECQDCKDLLGLALKVIDEPLNIVLLASTEAGHRENALVWCAKDRKAALVDVYLENKQPSADEIRDRCDRFGLMLAEQASMLFGIGQLPMFVDANGIGHTGEQAIYAVGK